MYSFYAYLGRMKNIERWALMRNTSKENILEHSAQVAHLAHGIALIAKKECSMDIDVNKVTSMALFHEISEVMTGDLPTPIKYYNSDITSAYKSIEKTATCQIISTLPEKYQDDYREIAFLGSDIEKKIVKSADKLAAYIKCLEEKSLGNTEFDHAEKTIFADIENEASNFKPLKIFIELYLDSFSMTLDELK